MLVAVPVAIIAGIVAVAQSLPLLVKSLSLVLFIVKIISSKQLILIINHRRIISPPRRKRLVLEVMVMVFKYWDFDIAAFWGFPVGNDLFGLTKSSAPSNSSSSSTTEE
jgi:hypothetical protein